MAVLKQRLHRKNSSGTYDVIYLENVTTNIKLSENDGTVLYNFLVTLNNNINSKQPVGNYQPAGSYAAANHNHAGVYQPVGSYVQVTGWDGTNLYLG